MRRQIACVLSLVASSASAEELKFFSHGPSVPFLKIGFKKVTKDDGVSERKGDIGLFNAGAGYSIYLNVMRNADKSGAGLSIGVPLYLSISNGSTAVSAAVTGNLFSNLISVGVGVDLFRSGSDDLKTRDSGALAWAFDAGSGWARENVFVLFNFGTNIGGISNAGTGSVTNALFK